MSYALESATTHVGDFHAGSMQADTTESLYISDVGAQSIEYTHQQSVPLQLGSLRTPASPLITSQTPEQIKRVPEPDSTQEPLMGKGPKCF